MRFYFNLKHPLLRPITDDVGIELESLDQAEIREVVEECLDEDPELAANSAEWTLELTDSSGTILLTVNLARLLS